MEHDIEKHIRTKVQQVEATPIGWAKQAVWQSIRETEQPPRSNGFRYVAAAASLVIALSFFSDGMLHRMNSPQKNVARTTTVLPLSKNPHEDNVPKPSAKAEQSLAQTSRRDVKRVRFHSDTVSVNHTSTPTDAPSRYIETDLQEGLMQGSIASEPSDSVVLPVQHKKVIHAIVGILETSSHDTLAERKQNASRLKFFKRHERDLKNTSAEKEKSMMARIN